MACLAASISAASELLPPPQLVVTVETIGVQGTRVEAGKRYTIYVTARSDGSHSGLLVRDDGLEIYQDLPVRVQGCHDTSLLWPDTTGASVWSTSDAAVARLVAYAVRLNPCVLTLDLPLTLSPIPARPTPGIPGKN
jgi:hypothetical protein